MTTQDFFLFFYGDQLRNLHELQRVDLGKILLPNVWAFNIGG